MNDSISNEQLLKDLLSRVEALERAVPKDQFTIGVVSGDPEHALAAFMIALGATTFDTEVEMFFMLKGVAVLRDPKKTGTAPPVISFDLKKHGAMSLEELISMAGELGVRITVCNLSMDLLGLKPEDLMDYPNLSFAGVASLIDMGSQSKQCWFM